MTDLTPILELPLLAESQASAEIVANESFNRLDILAQIKILDRDLTAPPGSPANGDAYLVATGGSGSWLGKDGKIAYYQSGWLFVTVKAGFVVYVADENKLLLRSNSGTWVDLTPVGLATESANTFYAGPTTSPSATPTFRALVAEDIPNPLLIGPNASQSVDAQLIIARNVDNGTSGNGHCFSDSSVLTRSSGGPIGYNSFDGRIVISGSATFDHYAPFQAAPETQGTITLTNYYAFNSSLVMSGGTVTNRFGFYGANPIISGGTLTNNYGSYIVAQTAGANNFAYYDVAGPSYFGGKVWYKATSSTFPWAFNGTSGVNTPVVEFQISGVANAYVGVSGGADGIITGSVSGDSVWRTTGGKVLASCDNGTTAHFGLTANGLSIVGTIAPKAYTVATLPTPGTAGRIAYATDARNVGELGGTGTGSLVADDSTNWKIPGIPGAVAA